jgi:hypothetical protein
MTTDDFRSRADARCELMLDVTRKTLEEDPDLRLCEGLRLIEHELPGLRNILMERFGLLELPSGPIN